MLNKIDIPGTDITLEIVDKTITITNKIEYDMQMHFRNTDADAILIGSYFVNHGQEFGNLESHKVS